MRAFLEIVRFELRYQLRSPFFWGAILVFWLIHFLTVTSTGINLGVNHRIDINGTGKIIQVLSTLNYLAMVPVIVFAVKAIIRDYEQLTVSFIFVTPVNKQPFLSGRFIGAFIPSLLVGLASVLGTLIGTYMPWLDQERIGEYTWIPYGFSVLAILLPNLFIMCALFFAMAALTRSVAMTVAVAMAIVAMDGVLAVYTGLENAGWIAMADPFATLAIVSETRYWTVPELNAQLPRGLLLEHRALWLGLAVLALTFAFRRFRWELPEGGGIRTLLFTRKKKGPATTVPSLRTLKVETRFLFQDSMSQLLSQLRMDLASVLKSPLIYILLLVVALATAGDFYSHTDPLSGLRYYPLTSLMLEFFRFGLLPYIIIIGLYYAGALIYREEETGVSEIVSASPYPDGIMLVSKIVALCLVASALLTVVMATSIVLQAVSGYTDFELGLYLQSLFVYNGFYYAMLCVLAVVIQSLMGNKWLGTLVLFAAFVVLMSMESIGVEHILVGYRIPYAIYSGMNGYGPASAQVFALIAYWGFFCVLLMLVCHLFYRRSSYASIKGRIAEARRRFTRGVATASALAVTGFVCAGSWIFYNTNILNQYQTTEDRQRTLAEYEIKYAQYLGSPAPSFQDVNMEVDLYPEKRSLESRGSAILRNHESFPINEFVVSIKPGMLVNRLNVDSATLTKSDPGQGFYLFALQSPLDPGATVKIDWDLTRRNKGFANANQEYEIVANGTLVHSHNIMPIPGFDGDRSITDNVWRRRLGLAAAEGLPALGDPDYLDEIRFGSNHWADFRATVSTSAHQIAVTSGMLQRDWVEDGRRYFEYVLERPIRPQVVFTSARYEVARDSWNDVALEIYYDPKYGANIEDILTTIKRTMDYATRNFAPYPLSSFRILEYPGYRSAAQAYPGGATYPEMYGFITDNSESHNLDYGTIHELAHHWWGGLAYGAKMQGREMLNETLAQYSVLMVLKENFGPEFAGQVAKDLEDGYLMSRQDETDAELPLMYTEDQGYISYNKGPLAFYAMTDAIGEDRVNEALRNYLDKFAIKGPPFPTSRDVVNELRAVAGEEQQQLITDLFENIVLYDFAIESVEVQSSDSLFDVAITLTARQFEADGSGKETEVALSTDVDIVILGDPDTEGEKRLPVYQGKHRVETGTQTIAIEVANAPASVEIDPFHKRIDRSRQNNSIVVHR